MATVWSHATLRGLVYNELALRGELLGNGENFTRWLLVH